MKDKKINRMTITNWFTIFLFGLCFNGYTQQLIIKDPSFTLLTPFTPMNGDKSNVFQLALAQTKSDKDNYILLLENHVNDFSLNIIDTTHLADLLLKAYSIRSRNGSSWMEEMNLKLPVFKKSIPSNSKGILVAFSLLGSEAFDLKGQTIGGFEIHNVDLDGKVRSETAIQVAIRDPAKFFFVTHAPKITSKKGSFDDISKFKANKITFYSLFSKDLAVINNSLGTPFKTEQRQNNNLVSYETTNGFYYVEFKDGKCNRIEFIPKMKIKYIGKIFILDSYPIEITGCNSGEYTSKESSHRISFISDGMKYLEKVIAEEN